MYQDENTITAIEADYLYIKESNITNAGKGLYTAIPIYKDEIIAHFDGEILNEHEIIHRVETEVDQYFIAMLDGSILDSRNTNCFAKFANDANAYPNSLFRNNCKITIDEFGAVCLTATKRIKSHEEIFCSYGKRYWNKHG